MTGFRVLPGESRRTYSPVCVRVVDDLSGEAPLGRVEAELDLEVSGQFEPTTIRAVRTMSGLFVYPDLGRAADVTQPARNYRVRFKADYYDVVDAPVEFLAPPFNDTNPPAQVNKKITTVVLAPAVNYPFPTHLRVLRGDVVDKVTKRPLPGAKVSEVGMATVLCGAHGEFALALRKAPLNGPADILAVHPADAARVANPPVPLPESLKKNLRIEIDI